MTAHVVPVTLPVASGRRRRHRWRRGRHVQHLDRGGPRRRGGRGGGREAHRAASLACGSADVLEQLGIALEQPPERIAQSIDEHGFGFMFARVHHPAMRHAAPVRQELGTRTVFNVLGPLANPAGARDGVFGVHSAASRGRTPRRSPASARRAFVVHGDGGLDELSPSGPSLVVEVVAARFARVELDPRSLGIYPSPPEELRGRRRERRGRPAVLDGERSARRDAVLLNAAAAIVAAGLADDLGEGLETAAAAVDSGAAAELSSDSWRSPPRRCRLMGRFDAPRPRARRDRRDQAPLALGGRPAPDAASGADRRVLRCGGGFGDLGARRRAVRGHVGRPARGTRRHGRLCSRKDSSRPPTISGWRRRRERTQRSSPPPRPCRRPGRSSAGGDGASRPRHAGRGTRRRSSSAPSRSTPP